MHRETFVHRSQMPASAERLFRWHNSPGALARLTPPWERVRVVQDSAGLRDGAEVILEVRTGPFPAHWVSRLEGIVPGRQFRDVQISGPFRLWEHTHRMLPDGEGRSVLEDSIEFALPLGVLGHWAAGWFVRRKLHRMFEYRHRVTREALAADEAA